MCLFRKCDESIVETKEYPSFVERLNETGAQMAPGENVTPDAFSRKLVTTIKCAACGRIRIDQRAV